MEANSLAERDAVESGVGFVLKTKQGDIRVSPENARLVFRDGKFSVECSVPLIVSADDVWLVIRFDGGDIIKELINASPD